MTHIHRDTRNLTRIVDSIERGRIHLSLTDDYDRSPAYQDRQTIDDQDTACWAMQRFKRRQAKTYELKKQADHREMVKEAFRNNPGSTIIVATR